MARIGRAFPNRPVVHRPIFENLWTLSGVAPSSSSAAGAIVLTSAFGGVAPASSGAPGGIGLLLVFGGVAPSSSSAAGALLIIEPNLAAMAMEELTRDVSTVLRRVDIYEHDAETLWLSDAGALEWTVEVSDGDGPRRTLTASLYGGDGALMPSDDGFGFTKVLKVYRGVVLSERADAEYWWPVGVFDIEPLSTKSFPRDVIGVAGVDFAGRLQRQSPSTVTVYPAGLEAERVIEAIATSGDVTRFRTEATGRVLSRDFTLEPTAYLWDAITQVAADNGLEAYFDAAGWLVIRQRRNADELPTDYSFAGGPGGNLVHFEREQSRGGLYNHWTARGESSSSDTPPVSASVENNEPTSPVSVDRIGRQSAPVFVSSAITTEEEALVVAEARRAAGALRGFHGRITGIVAPWLDAGSVVAVDDPNPDVGAPSVARWRLTSFTIPSALGSTDYDAERVEYVGARTMT